MLQAMRDDVRTGFQHEEDEVPDRFQLCIGAEEQRGNDDTCEQECDEERQHPKVWSEDSEPEILADRPFFLFIIDEGEQMVGEEHQRGEEQNKSIYAGYRSNHEPEHEGQAHLDDREVGKEENPCSQLPFQGEPKTNPVDAR